MTYYTFNFVVFLGLLGGVCSGKILLSVCGFIVPQSIRGRKGGGEEGGRGRIVFVDGLLNVYKYVVGEAETDPFLQDFRRISLSYNKVVVLLSHFLDLKR